MTHTLRLAHYKSMSRYVALFFTEQQKVTHIFRLAQYRIRYVALFFTEQQLVTNMFRHAP